MSSNNLEDINRAYLFKRLEHWLRAFWPLLLVIGAGATIFRSAVVDSIMSTMHPALVYTIFCVLGIAVALSSIALWRFEREERLAMQLQALPDDERLYHLQSLTWKSEMRPVYDVLLSPSLNQVLPMLQQKAESEMFNCEEHLLSRLELPNYLSNSLIGIGLVGTFIGLLSSLADLGVLLSGLEGAGGGSSDPVAMFSDMMHKLQKPMKGMGTSFVASLYGLMGSLLMGLVIHSIRKAGNQAVMKVRELLRRWDAQFVEEVDAATTMDLLSTAATLLEKMLTTIHQEREVLSHGLDKFSDSIHQQSNLLDQLNQRVSANSGQIQQLGAVLSQLKDSTQRLADQERRSTLYGSHWVRIGVIMAIGVFFSTLVTSVVAVRNAEQQANQFALFLRAVEHQREKPVTTGSDNINTQPVLPATGKSADSMYVVLKDDALGKIANRHDVQLKVLLKANPEVTDPNRLHPGQRIRIPVRTEMPGR